MLLPRPTIEAGKGRLGRGARLLLRLRHMVSLLNVRICAALAVLFWSCLDLRSRATPACPRAAGRAGRWAVQNAVALPLFLLIGFYTTRVVAVALFALVASIYAIWAQRRVVTGHPSVEMPTWAIVCFMG